MINSMTAFASHKVQNQDLIFSWEIKSVNNRYLDLSFRLPDIFRELEIKLRDIATSLLSRGKIEIALRLQNSPSSASPISLNQNLLSQLKQALNTIKNNFDPEAKINPLNILSWPGVIQASEDNRAIYHENILTSFKQAIELLNLSRSREGEKLASIILEKLASIESEVKNIRERYPNLIKLAQEKLQQKFQELLTKCDPQRLEQEFIIHAQRADITEEVDRLIMHIGETRRVLNQGGAVGRRLDFLMQELNREANTLGSKSIDDKTSHASVEIKVLIEQMREQIQNIE